MKRANSVQRQLQVDNRNLKALIGKLETRIDKHVIFISKNTRRMLNQAYKQKMRLQRVSSLKRLISSREQNFNVQQSVKELRAAKRLPHRRIRNRDEMATHKWSPVFYSVNGRVQSVAQGYFTYGIRSAIQDWRPILHLDPPINETNAQRFKVYGLSSSVYCRGGNVVVVFPQGKWALPMLWNNTLSIPDTSSTPLNFDLNLAKAALVKAYAKVYEADIQTNEYVFEWKQVLNLVKDPLRTVVKSHKLIKKWVSRDQWIMLPSRVARKHYKGLLISKRPTGAVLMSMRTRRTMDPIQASAKVVEEAANRWLQYRYGIMPLAQDITTVYGLWLTPEGVRFPLLSKSARVWVSKTETKSESSLKITPLNFKYRVKRETGHFYSAKVWYQLRGDIPASYKAGMHPSQLKNALYNAIPYSFVFDWVVNLDEWMKATMNVDWIVPVANVVTAKSYDKYSVTAISASYISSPYYPAVIDKSIYGIKVMERMNRKINLPRPTLPVVSSAWRSVKNLWTSLALIISPILKLK